MLLDHLWKIMWDRKRLSLLCCSWIHASVELWQICSTLRLNHSSRILTFEAWNRKALYWSQRLIFCGLCKLILIAWTWSKKESRHIRLLRRLFALKIGGVEMRQSPPRFNCYAKSKLISSIAPLIVVSASHLPKLLVEQHRWMLS